MRRSTAMCLTRGLAAVVLLSLLSVGSAADTVKWTLTSQPSSGGALRWQTSSPAANGTATGRKVVTFDINTFLDVWAEPEPGWQLVSFRKGSDEMIFALDGALHFQFGPAGTSHALTAVFVPVLPTTTIDLTAPLDNAAVTNMVDLTGNYTGVSPTSHARNYAIDVTQDESGKVVLMGTIDGIEPTGGGPISGGSGKVSTVNDEPMATGKGKFAGTRDAADAKATVSMKGPAELQGPGANTAETSMSYKAVAGGVPFADKNVPVQATLTPGSAANVQRAWSIRLDVVERAPSKSKKPYVAVSAVLTLPNGDVIEFAEKKAKYTAKNGLKASFKKGTNTSIIPNAVDKKTKVSIKNMTLEEVGDDWVVTGGEMKYKFLGQKGSGNVVEFLDD